MFTVFSSCGLVLCLFVVFFVSFVFCFFFFFYIVFFFFFFFFFFSSRRRHTRSLCDWSSDVCSSDLGQGSVFCFANIAERFTRDQGRRHQGRSEQVNRHDDRGRDQELASIANRSEERRVGKECRSRWSPDH